VKLIAGDIGGTKCLLATFDTASRVFKTLREERYESARFDGLASVVRAFLVKNTEKIEAACFAVAGPVKDGEVITSNLPWHVNGKELASVLGLASVRLVNDFEAVGYGLDQLQGEDLATLQAGTRSPTGPIAVLGAGTGLGEAYLVWDGKRYNVCPSEGGHVEFGPQSLLETGLLEHLRRRFGHVSYERILSGSGLAHIQEFLVASGVEKATPEVAKAIEHEDPAAVVSKHGLARTDASCVRALDMFASIYGAQAGNLALTLLASGGVYLAGGIAPRIISKLQEGGFLRAFREKGRLSPLLERMPVSVIMNTRVGLLGAASLAAREGAV
jgi:glucokinase